jgi:hypothetical protein
MAINLSRNTRLWVSTVTSGHDNSNTFEIPIQEGYSLSQSVSTSDVTLDEAGPAPTRGSKRFNESLDPVEWSFTTYNTPYLKNTDHFTVDMLLWHSLANKDGIATDFDNSTSTSTVYGDSSSFKVRFNNNSAHVLTKLYLYFKIDNQVYLVSDAQVNQVEISVDISDISQAAWSGQALKYEAIPTPTFMSSAGLDLDEDTPTADSFVKIPASKNYLVNKLTTMSMNADVAPGVNDNYNIPITGATVTINNNITYLTPSTLAQVDSPIGSFTGSFEVTGSVEAYLRTTPGSTGTSGNPYGAAELLQHMLSNVQGAVTNAANITLNVGGSAGPRIVINIPQAHLSVPDMSVDDVVSTSFEFKGIPSSTNLTSGDEISLDFMAE